MPDHRFKETVIVMFYHNQEKKGGGWVPHEYHASANQCVMSVGTGDEDSYVFPCL